MFGNWFGQWFGNWFGRKGGIAIPVFPGVSIAADGRNLYIATDLSSVKIQGNAAAITIDAVTKNTGITDNSRVITVIWAP